MVVQYINNLNAGNYAGAYASLSDALKKKQPFAQYEKSQKQNTVYKVTNVCTTDKDASTKEIKATVLTSDKKGKNQKVSDFMFLMKKQGSDWKIDSFKI